MASSFTDFAKASAYTPPPDQAPKGSQSSARAWFPNHQTSNAGPNAASSSSQGPASSSYQAGGIPSWGHAAGGGYGYGGYAPQAMGSSSRSVEAPTNEWETRFGWRVDAMAAAAYLLGPITALVFLILETHTDYVRFHCYQSALLTTPLILLRLFLSLIHFPAFLLTLLTLFIVISALYMAFRAYRDANQGDLSRYQLPWIGELADRWVREE